MSSTLPHHQGQHPKLLITINFWSILHEVGIDSDEAVRQQLKLIKDAGFDAYFSFPDIPNLKQHIQSTGLRYAGRIDTSDAAEFRQAIQDCLEIDNGPINCQLGKHDTPTAEAIDLAVSLMNESKAQGARVHIEVHRDKVTETPEKTTTLIDACKQQLGELPLMNFDYSHPAIVKHLVPEEYTARLFQATETFQHSNLWHMRPFNGHHCQIPITDGNGNFSPEYKEFRPFITQALQLWLDGPRPNNELWVCPELGTTAGYNLSCFPNIWEDTIVLGKDIQSIWNERLTHSN